MKHLKKLMTLGLVLVLIGCTLSPDATRNSEVQTNADVLTTDEISDAAGASNLELEFMDALSECLLSEGFNYVPLIEDYFPPDDDGADNRSLMSPEAEAGEFGFGISTPTLDAVAEEPPGTQTSAPEELSSEDLNDESGDEFGRMSESERQAFIKALEGNSDDLTDGCEGEAATAAGLDAKPAQNEEPTVEALRSESDAEDAWIRCLAEEGVSVTSYDDFYARIVGQLAAEWDSLQAEQNPEAGAIEDFRSREVSLATVAASCFSESS